MKTKTIMQRAFFGKTNCLKVQLNDKSELYFQFGIKNNEEWVWKNIKMNDLEIGDVLNVIEGAKQSTSFIHDFNGKKTQLWINKTDNALFLKIKETTKGLNNSEVVVLRELLKHSIVRMNIKI